VVAEFLKSENWNVFTGGATTGCAMVKQMRQSDLICLKDAELTFHGVLTVDSDAL
jgi:hypothetical protein